MEALDWCGCVFVGMDSSIPVPPALHTSKSHMPIYDFYVSRDMTRDFEAIAKIYLSESMVLVLGRTSNWYPTALELLGLR